MTDEQKKLGHAFFDGKVLQYKTSTRTWADWKENCCPDFAHPYREWRIKPDEPKKQLYLCFDDRGILVWQSIYRSCSASMIRVPELDREVTLPEGE